MTLYSEAQSVNGAVKDSVRKVFPMLSQLLRWAAQEWTSLKTVNLAQVCWESGRMINLCFSQPNMKPFTSSSQDNAGNHLPCPAGDDAAYLLSGNCGGHESSLPSH